MKKLFHECPIGTEFVERNGDDGAIYYRKVTKSRAMCIEQVGYGNRRMVNSIYVYGSFATIHTVEPD